MTYDTSMPALLGYLATTLYNPNNVATEASPLTSVMEREVGLQLCEMLGYDVSITDNSRPWGHITCGGSIANLESIWAARNLKFYPLSLACALEPGAPLESIRDIFNVELCDGETKLFSQLDTWELLNLKPETVFAIPERLENEFDISSSFLSAVMSKYLIQNLGKDVLEKKYNVTKPTRYFVGGTKHYSWPKGAAITGIGSDNIKDIPVDINARLDASKLDQLLQECLDEKRAVYAVVAIMGSTEHGAVDPLKDVWELRNKYQKLGLSFAIHADAAWGGYFASLLREEHKVGRGLPIDPDNKYVPELALSDHTRTQLDHLKYADSITIDPHKSGYIPYPGGGLCYRDGRMRFLVTWLNPDVYKDSDVNLEHLLWQPGFLTESLVYTRMDMGPYSEKLCLAMYTNWVTMDMGDPNLIVIPMNPIPAERNGGSQEEIQKQREYIRDHIVCRPNLELVRDDKAMALVREMGSDLSINAFACNFRLANGEINQDVVESNYLNTRIYERLSVTKIEDNIFDKPLFIMSTSMEQKVYDVCCNNLKRRLGVVGDQDLEILVNCVMSPFPTVSNFTKSVADDFKTIAHEEIERCLFRNTVTEDDFRFILQGTDKPYLTLLPMFNMANYRHQLILSCEIPANVMDIYRAERAKDPSATFFVGTTKDVKLDSILAGSFDAMLEKGLPVKNQPAPPRYASNFKVTNVKVLKDSPIDSKYLDRAFPDYISPPIK
ncbi:L-2,4-diaminobutyrate decarboxylase Short=DABA decarboxylase [Rhizoctonia solani AG-1 IB]|uniref:L-2,4-diaminobutyrate decarboxylase Short=DABA decarboxylase n=1 Tax=Thanatephorus cucumeris (strain AG1-IB / isolate 7/3/14) TaxID=1108050 RepID=M5BY78_THACB|nr:L-2,4-diaminobutyrate decarboxylase Short=DABA decarboxylase [Rhizoctonia solani AG-1 IB]